MRARYSVTLAIVATLLASSSSAYAQDGKTYVMKITLPTINDVAHQLAKDYATAVERDSGGRIKTEVYPASQLGTIARQIEGVQFGAIQCAVILPEFFVGVDERFEVLAAPGLVDSFAHGQRLAADPAVLKLILGLGANKGLHGVGLFMAVPSSVISRTPIRHLADFKGKKIRATASQFQTVALSRLGATPVSMTLGDVLPALQQGAIDAALASIGVFSNMHYNDAAKYVTETNQPALFIVVEVSKTWYDSLPADLQQVVDKDGVAETAAIDGPALEIFANARKAWVNRDGELISLPRDEQAEMMRRFASVADDVSKTKPAVYAAYQVVSDAAKRTRQAASQ